MTQKHTPGGEFTPAQKRLQNIIANRMLDHIGGELMVGSLGLGPERAGFIAACIVSTISVEMPEIAAAPDLYDQVTALTSGWTVEPISMYDEEGVEGWRWTDPNGVEHCEVGLWDELPPWPESARAALAKEEGGE